MFSNLILLLTAGFTLLDTIYAEAWGNKAELNARRQSAYAAQHQVKRSTGKPTGNYKYLTNNTQRTHQEAQMSSFTNCKSVSG